MRGQALRLFYVRREGGLCRCSGGVCGGEWGVLGDSAHSCPGPQNHPLGSHPHSLVSSLPRSGGSSDNHYYRVPHHGHCCSDNNSCLKKLVRSLRGLLGLGAQGQGVDRVGAGVRFQLQGLKPVAPGAASERHCRRKSCVFNTETCGGG